jgi:hypothetical protein
MTDEQTTYNQTADMWTDKWKSKLTGEQTTVPDRLLGQNSIFAHPEYFSPRWIKTWTESRNLSWIETNKDTKRKLSYGKTCHVGYKLTVTFQNWHKDRGRWVRCCISSGLRWRYYTTVIAGIVGMRMTTSVSLSCGRKTGRVQYMYSKAS